MWLEAQAILTATDLADDRGIAHCRLRTGLLIRTVHGLLKEFRQIRQGLTAHYLLACITTDRCGALRAMYGPTSLVIAPRVYSSMPVSLVCSGGLEG